jgi:hypothetical protein
MIGTELPGVQTIDEAVVAPSIETSMRASPRDVG